MALSIIAFIAPNYRDFSTYWLKAYEPGTVTPKTLALDSGSATVVAKLQLNADGFLVSSGGALVIPYVDDSYDLWLFPTEDDADANNTSAARRVADDVNATNLSLINDLSQAYEFDTYQLMKDSAIVFTVGKKLTTKGFDSVDDGGGANYIVTSGSTTEPVGSPDLTGGGYAKLKINGGVLKAEQYGILGNNGGSPYSSSFIEFMDKTASDEVSDATFPNKIITFDNTTPASFQSNCTYTGGRNTFINPTVNNSRAFLTQNKDNFEINKLRSYIGEDTGLEDTYIGGGYWRFESCSYFDINYCEASRSFGTGFKFALCTRFNLKNVRGNFNAFTGCELEGCDTYTIEDYDFSFNGRYSSNQDYKPLPTGWTGTHGGRGIVVAANGDTVDQNYSRIQKGRCQKNSEYNFRAFTANTKGVKNLIVEDFLFEDAGAPAGTYGTIVVASDKGVDLLLNSDATGESDNIQIKSGEINSSFSFGNHISIDGFNHRLLDVTCRCFGDAVESRTPFSLFGAKSLEMDGCRSFGAAFHVSFGSNNPQDITIINDIARGCLKYMNGNASAGFNILRNVKAFHSATAAISGEDGISLDGAIQWQLEDSLFQGFHQGVVVGSSATDLEFNRVITKATVLNGLRDFSAGGPDIVYNNCQFDSANPITRGSQVGGAGDNSQWAVGISWSSSLVTSGYYKAGHIMWKVNPGAVDGTHSRYLAGWHRLATGTGHVLNTDWREMWIHSDATTA